VVVLLGVVVVAAELGLRSAEMLMTQSPESPELPTGESAGLTSVAAQAVSHSDGGAIEDVTPAAADFAQARPDEFRIAVLADNLMLASSEPTGCLSRVSNALTGVAIGNYGRPHAGPREFAARAATYVVKHRPDLVMVFLSIGDAAAADASPESQDGWRSLRVVRYSMRAVGAEKPAVASAEADLEAQTYEQHLSARSRGLAVCRVPQNETAQKHWRRSTEHLDDLITRCAGNDIEVALVLVPADFQISKALQQTLVRRVGAVTTDYDFRLPQRKLAKFAQERGVAVLDLLPALAACQKPVFKTRGSYLSDDGLQVTAETVGGWLQSRYGSTIGSRSGLVMRDAVPALIMQ
jgi:hypothetical protein